MNEFFNKTKIKWFSIIILLLLIPLVGIPWLIYELWLLHSEGKLTAIIRILDNVDPPFVSVRSKGAHLRYSEQEVRRFKNIMIGQENFWDDDLSTEFCIAYRTRDILLSRKIVDDFVVSRDAVISKGYDDLFVSSLYQDYLKEYVTSELSLGGFWAIFIEPSQEFVRDFSKLDSYWYPKVTDALSNRTDLDGEDLLNTELTDMFRKHRNKKFWTNADYWMWFFRQYIKFLLDSDIDPESKLGMRCFIDVIVEMQITVEQSGWEIDYELYEQPLDIWGGQTIKSKFKHWLRGKKWIGGLKTNFLFK
jgi:hypothetical protein